MIVSHGYCDGTPSKCHNTGKATHVVTYANDETALVCWDCCALYMIAGYKTRPLVFGDIMAGKYKKRRAPEAAR